MKKQNKEKEGIPDKRALSDDDEENPRGKDASHGKSKKFNTNKWSKTPTENNKQETTGRQQGKSTSSTEVHDKAEDDAERNEIKDSDIFESSEQGQWPGYLVFFGYLVLIGFVIIMLYHVVYVRQLSTISNENVKSIITSILEEHYGPIFNQMMEEEKSKFRSSYLKPLEIKITTINKKEKHLDAAIQNVEGLIRNAEVNLKNLLSQQEDIPIRIDDIKTDLEDAENNIKTVQATIDAQVTQVKSSIEKLNNLQKQLDEKFAAIEGQSRAIANKLQQLTEDQQSIYNKHDLQKQELNSLREHTENTKRHLATVETTVTSLTSSVSALYSRLNQTRNLTDAVDCLQSKYEEKIEPNLFNKGGLPLITFSVSNPTKLSLVEGELILFQNVQHNEGVGYNDTSGIFTSPVDGNYLFAAHFCNSGGRHFAYAIVHIDTEVARSTSFAQVSGCGSVNAIVKVKKGDQVKLKATAPTNVLEENRWRQSSFVGVLIHK